MQYSWSGPPPAHAAILSPMDIDERIRLALGDRHDVCLAYLFGSCASGTARPGSDVDVAILFQDLPTPASVSYTHLTLPTKRIV